VLGTAAPAAAQSTYVGASLVGDVARYSKVDDDDDGIGRILVSEPSGDGEALGFNVKVGRLFSERWGLEFEFARSGEFESRSSFIAPAIRERLDIRIPAIEFEYEMERSHTMFGALAFVRQDIGDRFDLTYLGGIVFNRVETEQSFDDSMPVIQVFPPIAYPDYETVDYSASPAVGLEGAFKFGAAAVTGGVRLQTAGGARGGWLIRPNVGMRWSF
jgi:hypothetical protein